MPEFTDFSNPQEQADILAHQEAVKAEMRRFSMDEIMVYNPTDQDHVEIWNSNTRWLIPNKNSNPHGFGNGRAVVPRYIALNYVERMAKKLITNKIDDGIKKENDRRAKAGLPIMNKWLEQPQFELQQGLTMSRENLAQVVKDNGLVVGLYREFGRDFIPSEPERQQKIDRRPFADAIVSELTSVKDNKIGAPKYSNVTSEEISDAFAGDDSDVVAPAETNNMGKGNVQEKQESAINSIS